ncbi:acireductone synthase, partial [Kosakonia sp. H7A]|uniref:acireductone synthase n=1 Tax=Kosakonia sp. H7A TaxID=2054598 RepID=UPI000D151193
REHGGHPQVRHWLNQVADEIGEEASDDKLVLTLQQWIDEDRKTTALKALEGMIWEAGYRDADFTAHIYPDAARLLRAWHDAGIPLYVYSSGSVPAQKLFFAHSDAGDLTGLISGWFDTQVGPKRESNSYRKIAESIGLPAPQILFLS